MVGETFFTALAAQIAWKEGSSEGINGAMAILFCIVRRSGENKYRLMNVLNDLFWGYTNETSLVPDPRNQHVKDFLGLVEDIMEGKMVDKLTNNGLYWGDKPYEGAEITATVGQLNLWR